MADIRKLQYIGKQYLLNVPASVVKESHWQKGDYLEIAPRGAGTFGLRKVAENSAQKTMAEIAALQQEATTLFAVVSAGGSGMSPGDFSAKLARFQYVSGKMRRLKLKLVGPAVQHTV